MPHEAATPPDAESVSDRSQTQGAETVEISSPVAEDAAEIHALIAACPPLDCNSLYANLIQTTHFSGTCAIARLNGKIAGWISGHRPPGRDTTYFLWQVAVHPDARGRGLAQRMLAGILARPALAGVREMETSITRDNEASWRLFRSLSRWLHAPMREEIWFDQDRHFRGQHATEFLVTIGPFGPHAPAR